MNALIDLIKRNELHQIILLEDVILKVTGKYVQPFVEDDTPKFSHKVTGREIALTTDQLADLNNVAYLFNCAANCKSIAEKERLTPQLLPYLEQRRIKPLFGF